MTEKHIYKWSVWERSFEVDLPHDYRTAKLYFAVTDPDGNFKIERGFWDGGKTWVVRYMPTRPGFYRFRTWGDPGNAAFNISGEFDVTDEPHTGRHGPIRRLGAFLFHADDTDHFHLGATAFGLFRADAKYEEFIDRYSSMGINSFRIMNYVYWGNDEHGQPAGAWLTVNPYKKRALPFPGCDDLDFSELDIEGHYQRVDAVLKYLLKKNCFAEVVIMANGLFFLDQCGQSMYIPNDPRLMPMIEELVIRLKAFPNFWYEVANEYRWGSTQQEELWQSRLWVESIIAKIRELDPKRLIALDNHWPAAKDPKMWEPEGLVISFPWYQPDAGSHRRALEKCDIWNLHSHRGPEWHTIGPAQMKQLQNYYNMPGQNDEPNRDDWAGGGWTSFDMRISAFLTAFVRGSTYYTCHGTKITELCRACIDDEDVQGIEHFAKFWNEFGHYNMCIANHLITGQGTQLRAGFAGDDYAYLIINSGRSVTIEVMENGTYAYTIMDIHTGQTIEGTAEIKDQHQLQLSYEGDFAIMLKVQ